LQKVLSGGTTVGRGESLEVGYGKTVVATERPVGFELARVNVVLNGLDGHPQEMGGLFRLDEVRWMADYRFHDPLRLLFLYDLASKPC